jgi:hypothetical protein
MKGRTFKSRILRKIFGSKGRESNRRLHNEELRDVYSAPDIARAIKSGRMSSARHVACMGVKRVLVGIVKQRYPCKT